MAFVTKNNDGKSVLDLDGLLDALRLAARIGLRMTNVTLELPDWDAVQKRDRLTGVSITGYVAAMDALDVDTTVADSKVPLLTYVKGAHDNLPLMELLWQMQSAANRAVELYASDMRITVPLLCTAIKPSGSISQLPTVSSGAHASYAPYYIRRVRISSFDPLAKTMLEVGYPVYPEATTMLPGDFNKLSTFEKMKTLDAAQTWVIEFPIKTSAKVTANGESAVAQLNRYFLLQEFYTDHNTSITVTFSPDEVDEIIDTLLNNWDNYIGVSFLPKFSGAYPLMPYEEITAEEYEKRAEAVSGITWKNITDELRSRELILSADDELDADCVGGACPVR